MSNHESTDHSESSLVGNANQPDHVAIIMDGNGRWATKRGLPRIEGHRRGLETLRVIVRHAAEIGIGYLTLYSFSSENWQRPASEVNFLLGLMKRFVSNDLEELHSAGIRVRIIGDRSDLAEDILYLLENTESRTACNKGMVLTVAFNYGGRNEIVRGIREFAKEVAEGRRQADEICEKSFSCRLDTGGLPDPDLIIRTSGEKRLSNFLLWQAAYSEFVFREEYWPEFTPSAFDESINEFLVRERRFGGLNEIREEK